MAIVALPSRQKFAFGYQSIYILPTTLLKFAIELDWQRDHGFWRDEGANIAMVGDALFMAVLAP